MVTPNPQAVVLKALAGVKEPGRRAEAVFELLKPRGAERKSSLDLRALSYPGGDEFRDIAPTLVDLAFRNREMKLGVDTAAEFGLAADLYERVIEVSTVRPEDRSRKIFELPGADKDRWGWQSNQWEATQWFNGLQVHIAREYLLRFGRVYDAADLLLTAGQTQEAFQIAIDRHLEPERILELCERHQTGFAYALNAARVATKPSLERHVEAAHVESLVSGRNRDIRDHDRPRRISMALELAQQYGFEEKRKKQILEEGVRTLINEREERFIARQREEDAYAERHRWGRERYQEDKPKDPTDEHQDSYAARVKDLTRVSSGDQELVELLKMLPDDERTQPQTRFFQVCEAYGDRVSLLHVATGLKLWETAFEASTYLAHYDRYGYSGRDNHEYRKSVLEFVDANLLRHLDDERAKIYLRQISWTHCPDASLRVARQKNLGEWLTQELIKESQIPHAARLQNGLGNSARAIALYEQAECFSAAAELTKDPVEQSRLGLLAFDREYRQSKRFEPMFKDHVDWYRIRRQAEEITESLDLAKEHRTDPRYVNVVKTLVGNFCKHGDYDLAILLVNDSGLTDVQILLPDNLVETAASQGNFEGAYALSKAIGDPAAVAYEALAESTHKPGSLYKYSSFRDLLPKPAQAGSSGDPDEIPF